MAQEFLGPIMAERQQALEIFLDQRRGQGLEVEIPLLTDNIKSIVDDRYSSSVIEFLAKVSVRSNVVLIDDTLLFFSPMHPTIRETKIKGYTMTSAKLAPGMATVGGPLFVGGENGDLYFPNCTAMMNGGVFTLDQNKGGIRSDDDKVKVPPLTGCIVTVVVTT